MGRMQQWWPVIGLITVMTLLQAVGPELLRYETRLIIGEQHWWRLLSGHWVHANWVHYALNMAGLVLCLALTEPGWRTLQWLWRVIALSIGISLLFVEFNPRIGWYVGFSGVLFGLYILTALTVFSRQRLISTAIIAVIAIKLLLDLYAPVKVDSSGLIGVPVLGDAHLYGVIIALLIALLQYVFKFVIQGNKTQSHD
jgi:rhomboid family GlyGly-CTERM serine protease